MYDLQFPVPLWCAALGACSLLAITILLLIRYRHKLFAIAAIASLILFVLLSIGLPLSNAALYDASLAWNNPLPNRQRNLWNLTFLSAHAQLQLTLQCTRRDDAWSPTQNAVILLHHTPDFGHDIFLADSLALGESGFVSHTLGFQACAATLPPAPWGNTTTCLYSITIPYWFALLLCIPVPVFYLRKRLRTRALNYAQSHQLCLTCRYDLRATPTRCPECGAIPTHLPKIPLLT